MTFQNTTAKKFLQANPTATGKIGFGFGFGSGVFGSFSFGNSDDIFSIYGRFYTRKGVKTIPYRYNKPTQIETVARSSARYLFRYWVKSFKSVHPNDLIICRQFCPAFKYGYSYAYNQYYFLFLPAFYGCSQYGVNPYGYQHLDFQ